MTSYTFPTPTPGNLVIDVSRGSLTVTATETATTEVLIESSDAANVQVVQTGDEIRIITPKSYGFFGFHAPAYQITVTVPAMSRLRAKTGSADISTHGLLRAVWAYSGSGNIAVDSVNGPATLATGSGDIAAQRVRGEVQVKSGSGDIAIATSDDRLSAATGSGNLRIDQAGGAVSAKTGSGDLSVGTAESDVTLTTGSGDLTVRRAVQGRISGKGASSDIRIGVPAGTPVWTDATTTTGTLHSSITPLGAPAEGQPYVEFTAKTVSGDIYLENV